MIRDIIRELCALAALLTFVAGVGSVSLLVTEHKDESASQTVAMAIR